jgi:hypothetical protein
MRVGLYVWLMVVVDDHLAGNRVGFALSVSTQGLAIWDWLWK